MIQGLHQGPYHVCMWFILFWEQSHRPAKLKLIDSKWPAGRGYVIVAWRYHHWINDPLAWFLHEMLLACLEQNPPFLAFLTTMSANQLVCVPFHCIRTTLGGCFISLYFCANHQLASGRDMPESKPRKHLQTKSMDLESHSLSFWWKFLGPTLTIFVGVCLDLGI